MSTRITKDKNNDYIGGQYDSPWGTGEGIFSLPKETMTKIFNELDPASQTAASFTTRAFKEIHPPVCLCPTFFCEDAVQAGHLELIPWGITNRYRSGQIIQRAMKDGNLDLLKSLENLGVWTCVAGNALDAIAYGRLNVLQWMYERFGHTMLDSNLFEQAMFKGDLNILNWLKENRCPISDKTFDKLNKFPPEAALWTLPVFHELWALVDPESY